MAPLHLLNSAASVSPVVHGFFFLQLFPHNSLILHDGRGCVCWDARPSFTLQPSGSTLTGGAAAGSDPGTTIYSYNIVNPNNNQLLGYSGNGSLLYATDSVNGTWSYVYDDFNRLISSACSANCPENSSRLGFSYVYDRYGNRWQQNLTAGTGPAPQYSFAGGNNRITGSGVVYDSAGNVWNDGQGNTFTYDGENRIVAVSGAESASYVYDADGQRVQKTTGGATVGYIFDLSGREVTEVNASGEMNRGENYAGGRHLAVYANSTTYFPAMDWLGTERMRVAMTGVVCESVTQLPYGDMENNRGCDQVFIGLLEFCNQVIAKLQQRLLLLGSG